jgi:hypothetical protein
MRLLALRFHVKLAARSQELPTSLFLRGVDLGGVWDPAFMGGFADVFRARYQGLDVAVKRLRISSNIEKANLYPVRYSSLSQVHSTDHDCRDFAGRLSSGAN